MKRVISSLLLIVSFAVFSQTTEAEAVLKTELKAEHTGWKTGGVVNVNFSQAAFSTAWSSGGTNSMALNGLVSIFANDLNGDQVRDNIESQIGGYLRVVYKQPLMENINFESKLEAFSNYEEDPQNMYITWDNLLTMKVNDYVNANISFNMINRPGMEVVYKEVLGVGLSYKF